LLTSRRGLSNELIELSFSTVERLVTSNVPNGEGVDVYCLNVDANEDKLPIFEAALDERERQEGGRLRRQQQRCRLAISRGAFRLVLGAYLGKPAQAVPLVRDAWGKPRLVFSYNAQELHVSCSRSGPLFIFALAKRPVGIDIEIVTTDRFTDRVAEFMLSPREQRLYAALPLYARSRWLARAWVCKEAILKGIGCGLRRHPASIDAAPSPDDPLGTASGRSWRPAPGLLIWSLCEMDWACSVIAVAIQGRPSSLRFAELIWDFGTSEPKRNTWLSI
jgi:4'-phosphopantetheinyl transferase